MALEILRIKFIEKYKRSIHFEKEELGEGNFPAGYKTCYNIIEINMLGFDEEMKNNRTESSETSPRRFGKLLRTHDKSVEK